MTDSTTQPELSEMHSGAFPQSAWIAFDRCQRLASGSPAEVATAVKTRVDADPAAAILVFDQMSSEPIEIDLRGTPADVVKRLPVTSADASTLELSTEIARPVGRPKLGVIAREVTLLPRHWQWLAQQSGGASVALRKLVEQALRVNANIDRQRQSRESTYRFLNAIAGNEPGYEEAIRALFADDLSQVTALLASWPADVRSHALALAESLSLRPSD